jgi:CheY-like chemotaxis protein
MSAQMTWLLIDDDPDDRDIFLLTLEKVDKPIKCLTAKDGIEAMEKLKNGTYKPDCILLDLNMPLMDGMKCLVEIKKIDFLSRVPVFIYSTSSAPKFKEELKQHGAIDYIVKPSSIPLLEEILIRVYQEVERIKAA